MIITILLKLPTFLLKKRPVPIKLISFLLLLKKLTKKIFIKLLIYFVLNF